jgi:hypothetical protein
VRARLPAPAAAQDLQSAVKAVPTRVDTLPGPTAAAPDASSPKKAAIAFARAVVASDLERARSLAVGTDAEFDVFKSMSELLQASKRLRAAATKRFGEFPRQFDLSFLEGLPDQFERLEEKIEGDRATLVLKTGQADPQPPRLKRVGDGWKMDLSGLGEGPALTQIEKSVKMAKAMDTVAKDLESGKYKYVQESLKALQDALSRR